MIKAHCFFVAVLSFLIILIFPTSCESDISSHDVKNNNNNTCYCASEPYNVTLERALLVEAKKNNFIPKSPLEYMYVITVMGQHGMPHWIQLHGQGGEEERLDVETDDVNYGIRHECCSEVRCGPGVDRQSATVVVVRDSSSNSNVTEAVVPAASVDKDDEGCHCRLEMYSDTVERGLVMMAQEKGFKPAVPIVYRVTQTDPFGLPLHITLFGHRHGGRQMLTVSMEDLTQYLRGECCPALNCGRGRPNPRAFMEQLVTAGGGGEEGREHELWGHWRGDHEDDVQDSSSHNDSSSDDYEDPWSFGYRDLRESIDDLKKQLREYQPVDYGGLLVAILGLLVATFGVVAAVACFYFHRRWHYGEGQEQHELQFIQGGKRQTEVNGEDSGSENHLI